MAQSLYVLYLLVSILVIATSVLTVIQFHEHVRFARSRLGCISGLRCGGRAMLIVPCRGRELRLAGNLRAFFRQDYDDYFIRFVVESVRDPACPIIRRLMEAYPQVPAELVVAGLAKGSGQKNHNLLAATEDVPADVRYLAFADSDARPGRHWLSSLLSGLDTPNVAATTGYRWFLPTRLSLTNYLLHTINNQVGMFLGKHSPTVVWGGSWAIRRELFRLLDLRSAWTDTVCEDLVAGSLFRRAGLRVRYEPACMVISPIDTTLRDACAFIRRQYFFARCYNRHVWALIVALSVTSTLILWGSLIAAIGATLGAPWQMWQPATICAVLCSLSMTSGVYRVRAHAVYCPHMRDGHRTLWWLALLTEPLGQLLHLVGVLASTGGRWITWRGIAYQVDIQGRVVSIRREAICLETARIAAVDDTVHYHVP